jgi:lactate dehydrogenase-like 2-hydroxyacid dehydrogenase
VRASIYVTRRIPESGLALLRRVGRVEVNPRDRPLSRRELLAAARGRAAMVTQLVDRVDEAVLAAAGPRLRIVANYAAGHDNIDLAAAGRRGIVVTNTPDVLTDATAELAWALILAASLRLVEADAFTRSGRFRGWGPTLLVGKGITGKTLGVAGGGRIGSAVARLSRGFRMRVLYWGRRRNPGMERETGAVRVGWRRLLAESDVVSLHVPLGRGTRHLLGRREIGWMKRGAVLVNTARGAVVDERALVAALKRGKVFAAGLDVYEREPALSPGLAALRNVVLSPHVGSATEEARSAMAVLAARNVRAVLSGRAPLTPVVPGSGSAATR